MEKSIQMSMMELEAITKLLGNMTVNQWKGLGMDELDIQILTMAYRNLAEEFTNV